MRQLTEAQQKAAYDTFNHLYDTGGLRDHLQMVEYAFAAGLDHSDTELDALQAENTQLRARCERLKLHIKARDILLMKMGIDPARIKVDEARRALAEPPTT